MLAGTILCLSTTNVWGAPQPIEASADAYLELFMKSGIDCGVVIYDATHGDFGLPEANKKDTNSRCAPSSEIRTVRVGSKTDYREGMRSDTYLDISTKSWDPPSFKRSLETACKRGPDPKGTVVWRWTLDAKFTVVSQGGLGKGWADQAVKVVEDSLGGVDTCTILNAHIAANPNFGKRVELPPTKGSVTSKPKVKATPTPTSKKTTAEKTITCQINGKPYKIIGIDPKCPPSGTTSKGSTPTPKPSASTISEADKFMKQGCSSFPSAIVRLQNASGSTYNKAVVSAQEASFYIIDAAQLDSKYEGLRNAQRIIAQYVQDVGWGGRGYFGDINTVRTALATFNMACNSNLRIG